MARSSPRPSDPRAAAALRAPLKSEEAYHDDLRVSLVHRLDRSGIRTCATMDHIVDGPEGTEARAEAGGDEGRVIVAADVPSGGKLRVLKFLAYSWSSSRSLPSLRAQARGSLAEARHTGWEGLCAEQREYLDAFWEDADVEVDGDPELQQAVRFALFHVLQAGARSERRAIPAKGLTGSGYDGHAFWDTESFVLPVLTYTLPDAAGDALRWRLATLDLARERATQLGLEGAAFPWRTIAGRECSGYWPAGTAAMHIGADIAGAVLRYQHATDDPAFARDVGLPLLVETARLWAALGHHDRKGRFRLPGVTGPDEYSAISDDNTYTNLMARRNLLGAAEAVDRHPEEAEALGVVADEVGVWRTAADAMHVPYDGILDVHMQAEGFTHHARWDFEDTPAEKYPLLLHYPYFDLYRKQVVKQADLVMALYCCGDRFTDEEKARAFAYYEPLTVRDSSLSACVQAIMAAETGHLDLAYDYLGEAALMDLHDLEHNTRDGLHIASLAGSWLALVAGFGGFRDHDGVLTFAPRLPPGLGRLAFRICVAQGRVHVEVSEGGATYTLQRGSALEVVALRRDAQAERRRAGASRASRRRRSASARHSHLAVSRAGGTLRRSRLDPMAWDFSTDPDYAAKLDWARTFVREEIWPLETVVGDLSQEALDRIYAPLQEEVRARVFGPRTSIPSSAARAMGRSSWGCCMRCSARRRSRPTRSAARRRTPATARCSRWPAPPSRRSATWSRCWPAT